MRCHSRSFSDHDTLRRSRIGDGNVGSPPDATEDADGDGGVDLSALRGERSPRNLSVEPAGDQPLDGRRQLPDARVPNVVVV